MAELGAHRRYRESLETKDAPRLARAGGPDWIRGIDCNLNIGRYLRATGEEEHMPTVLRTGPYRFFFYSGDRDEPEHIHVEHGDNVVKFWLNPVRLDRSGRFGRAELRRVQRLVEEHQNLLLEAWHGYFHS